MALANEPLYRAGLRYTKDKYRRAACSHGVSISEINTAIRFARNVNLIAKCVGARAKRLILSERNPLLTPRRLMDLARMSPAALRTAISQAAAGLHPSAPVEAGGDGQHISQWSYLLLRLAQANQLLANANAALSRSIGRRSRDQIYYDATAIQVFGRAVERSLSNSTKSRRARAISTSISPQVVSPEHAVRQARRLIADVTCDFPLAAFLQAPSQKDARQFATMVASVADIAGELADRARADQASRAKSPRLTVIDNQDGPDSRGGTYVVVLAVPDATVYRVGRLGTFWLPQGYLLYVGSAFAAGGVKARTSRHLRTDVPRRWNIDHLKDIAQPVELWWTHFTKRVECTWAMSLAELSNMSCPAPQCGGNDCRRCPAHTYHSFKRPSISAFAEQLRQNTHRHGTIYRRVLD